MPELVRYQLEDGPHASEPTSGRGEVERRARACLTAACRAGLDSTVIETRFNVVRSGVPETVVTTRALRDYLPRAAEVAHRAGSEVFLDDPAAAARAVHRDDDRLSPGHPAAPRCFAGLLSALSAITARRYSAVPALNVKSAT
jgi:hypothetical protein